jgi:hypothetical protein
MTTGEMISELRAQLGNRNDILDSRYVTWLNWGQYDVCGFHKQRLFSPRRFHALEGDKLFSVPVLTGTVGGTNSVSTVDLNGLGANDDMFNDMVVEVVELGEKRAIFDYAGAGGGYIATVHPDWTVAPTPGQTFNIYTRRASLANDVGLSPQTAIWAIERLEEFADGTQLTPSLWTSLVGLDLANSIGTPSKFARRGNSLLFDYAPEETMYYRMWYYRYPTLLSSATPSVSSELDEFWHEVIVLAATFKGFMALMEPEREASARDAYVKMAIDRTDAFEIASPNIQRAFRIRRS